MLEEAYKRVMVEAKEAKPGYHFKKGSDTQYKNGHTSDGEPHGGSRLNSDPTYKNPNESQEQEDAEYGSEAEAYRDMSDKYSGEDSIEVGNIYKGESYHELVIGIKGDEVFTKKITLEDGNRYDKNQMLDEVKLAGKLDHDFLNEIM